MSLLKKRGFAVAVCAVVIAGSVAFGSANSLQRAADDVERGFYEGVETGGYRHKSIASQLKSRLDSVNGILALAEDYAPEEAEALRAHRADMYSALEYGYSPSYLYTLNEELTDYMGDLDKALVRAEMPEEERAAYDSYYGDFRAAMNVIAESGYNESVRAFERDVLDHFPAEFIYFHSDVSSPGVFA